MKSADSEWNHQSRGGKLPTTLPAWMDEAVAYIIDVPVFRDGNGDGIGDLVGVRDALDDLIDLGINAIWLLPFYESPRCDNGYDVTDHFTVDPRFGTIADFDALVADAHNRGIRIIIDLIANHTSNRHPWFEEARVDSNASTHHHYVWKKDLEGLPELEPVFPGFEASVWEYIKEVEASYLHHFYKFEPDLNPDEPAVRSYVKEVVAYWLERGVDGFRIDAAPFLGDDLSGGTPDPHDYLKEIRSLIDKINPDACILAEADLPAEHLPAYFGEDDEVHGLWDYMLNRRLYLAIARQSAEPVRASLLETPPAKSGQGWVNFLRHHDELSLSFLDDHDRQEIYDRFAPTPDMQIYDRGVRRRLAQLLDNDWAKLRWVFSLHLSLPSPPMILYGDEIGLQENLTLPERASIRTQMLWPDEHLTPTHILLANIVSREAVPIPVTPPPRREGAAEFRNWLRTAIHERQRTITPVRLSFELVETGNEAVLAHTYQSGSAKLICLHNFSEQRQEFSLEGAGEVESVLLSSDSQTAENQEGALQSLEPFGYRWLCLREASKSR